LQQLTAEDPDKVQQLQVVCLNTVEQSPTRHIDNMGSHLYVQKVQNPGWQRAFSPLQVWNH
jgi:hypothetical protein